MRMALWRCPLAAVVLALLSCRSCMATRPAAHNAAVFAAETKPPGCCDEVQEKDGLAERSEEVRNRVKVLQRHLNKVNSQIAKESVRKDRLEDDMKATHSDRKALAVETKILRGKRKKAEINLRKEEEQAMAAAKSARNSSSVPKEKDGDKEVVDSSLLHGGNESHQVRTGTHTEEDIKPGVSGEGWLWAEDVSSGS
mmetsp:Transcript_32618/g.74541  ORF Transcript_32618/g.74541 Transcript_32618/m.74541 type:complete len:197 (-) Transcript_32618:27-617(-)